MISVNTIKPAPKSGSTCTSRLSTAWITLIVSWIAHSPAWGEEECAERPLVSITTSARPRPPRLRLSRVASPITTPSGWTASMTALRVGPSINSSFTVALTTTRPASRDRSTFAAAYTIAARLPLVSAVPRPYITSPTISPPKGSCDQSEGLAPTVSQCASSRRVGPLRPPSTTPIALPYSSTQVRSKPSCCISWTTLATTSCSPMLKLGMRTRAWVNGTKPDSSTMKPPYLVAKVT